VSSPIAHTAAGYAVYSFFRQRLPPVTVFGMSPGTVWPALAVLFCLLPDLDVLAAFVFGSFARFHNNFSHSLTICTVAPVLLALPLKALTKLNLSTSFALILTCCYSHIVIDLFTMGRGVMLFWPFSIQRFHAPVSLFVGVPWSSELTSPFYLVMAVNDLCFAAALIALVIIIKYTEKRRNQQQKIHDI